MFYIVEMLICILIFASINLILYFCKVIYKSNLGYLPLNSHEYERSHTSNHETDGDESEAICK